MGTVMAVGESHIDRQTMRRESLSRRYHDIPWYTVLVRKSSLSLQFLQSWLMLFSQFCCGLTPLFSKKTSATDRAARALPVGHILPEGMRNGSQTWILLRQDSCDLRPSLPKRERFSYIYIYIHSFKPYQNIQTTDIKSNFESWNHQSLWVFTIFTSKKIIPPLALLSGMAEQYSPSSTKENMRCIRARSCRTMMGRSDGNRLEKGWIGYRYQWIGIDDLILQMDIEIHQWWK